MKKFNLIIKSLLIISLFSVIFGCSNSKTVELKQDDIIETLPTENPTKIVVYSKFLPVDVDNSQPYSLNASVTPTDKAGEKIIYTSDNTSVAEVDENGVVTVKGEGSAYIKMTLDNDSSVYTNVAVLGYKYSAENNAVPVKAVSVDSTYVELTKGDMNTYEIMSSIRPTDATSKEIGYISNNEYVAVVDENGVITGLNVGSTEIIAYAKANPAEYSLITVHVKSNESGSDFSPPANVKPLDLAGNPLSLIAKYQILEYSLNDTAYIKVNDDSNLRVNVDLSELNGGVVNILLYIKLNGTEVRLIKKETLGGDLNQAISNIFTSLGADITGKYTMNFVMTPEVYTQISEQGLTKPGEKIVLKLGKIEDYPLAGGMGSDIEYDINTVPVEEGGGTTTPPDSGENTGIEIKSITFDKTTYTAMQVNEQFKINAEISPVNATIKTLTWTSSDNNSATVDSDGNVTVLKNNKVTITATASNGVSASLEIIPVEKIDDFMLDVDMKEFIQEVDETFQITYRVFPFIMQEDERVVEYTSLDNSIVTVDENGLVTAHAEGETIINVKIDNIERQLLAVVLPKSAASVPVEDIILKEESGNYPPTVGTIKLGVEIVPSNAGDKRLTYVSSNPDVAEVNASGIITVKGYGETDITVTSINNSSATKVYHLVIETLPTKIVFERNDYGVALNGKEIITPEFEGNPSNRNVTYSIEDTSIAEVNAQTGEVTGLAVGTTKLFAESVNGLKTETVLHVYTPVVKGDVSTLAGTYEIIDFTQANGTLDVGTKEYGGVERMIGEMTITVTGNTVKVKSKIQMDSSKMNNFEGVAGFGKEEARKGQFQYTDYTESEYNENGFGTAGKTSAYITHDNDMLKLYQQWQEGALGITVDVNVNTWIRKKSDTVKDLLPDTLHWSKNGIDGSGVANAIAHHPEAKLPEKEPYYTYGLIVNN